VKHLASVRIVPAIVLAVGTIASPALAQDTPADLPDPTVRARDVRDIVGRLELGYRGVFVTNPGYNPFSTQDYFSGLSLAFSHTIFTHGPVSFAIGLSWDYGASRATARGDGTSLDVHRFMLPLELRLHPGPWGYAFFRVAPGAAHERLEVDEASAPSALTRADWLFATDASVGYALPVVPMPARRGRMGRLWVQGELGYSWVADERVSLQPTLAANDPQIADGIDLKNSLGLRGAFFRLAVAISY
jgi:hypothetical protein